MIVNIAQSQLISALELGKIDLVVSQLLYDPSIAQLIAEIVYSPNSDVTNDIDMDPIEYRCAVANEIYAALANENGNVPFNNWLFAIDNYLKNFDKTDVVVTTS